MRLEKAITLCLFMSIGGLVFVAMPGILLRSDPLFYVGGGLWLFFGGVMFLLIVFDVITS